MTGLFPPSQLQIFGGEGAEAPVQKRGLLLMLIAATAVSLGVLWLATRSPLLVGGFVAAQIALWGMIDYFRRSKPAAAISASLPPDWSITRMTAELSGAGVAVSDRAGRLVCANSQFTTWFDGLRAPPDMNVDEAGREILVGLARAAWRDGQAQADGLRHANAEYSA